MSRMVLERCCVVDFFFGGGGPLPLVVDTRNEKVVSLLTFWDIFAIEFEVIYFVMDGGLVVGHNRCMR